MTALETRLDLVRLEIEKLRAQEALLLDMIREESGSPKGKRRAPRSNVKQTVLSFLEEAKSEGTNATRIVEKAQSEGVTLERGTVSSLLSRLKNEGVVDYNGSVYTLKQYVSAPNPNIHPIRTSGGHT